MNKTSRRINPNSKSDCPVCGAGCINQSIALRHCGGIAQKTRPAPVKRHKQVKVGPSKSSAAEPEIKYLTEGQVEDLFRAIESSTSCHRIRDRALFRLIYHRGLRASEPGLLQMQDWDAAESTLWVRRNKGSESGRYHLVAVEAAALRGWLRIRGVRPGPIFLTRKRAPICGRQVRVLMHEYSASACIPVEKGHPHALKHSCGTHVLARVQDLVKVKDHLGHRSIASTEIYAKVLGVTRNAVADQLRDWR